MCDTTINEKSKPKKKSIVERFVYFASHTARINKKSEKRNNKKKQKKSNKNESIDDKRKFSKSLMELNKDEIHACTFCDYCDTAIFAEFTGQNIICHQSCKENHNNPDPVKEYSTELQMFGSIKSEKVLVTRETSFSENCREIVERKLSIKLNERLCDESTLKMRDGTGRSNFLPDTETGTYTFSTVDLPTIKQYGISIKNVASVQNYVSPVVEDIEKQISLVKLYPDLSRNNNSLSFISLLPENLRKMIDIFNSNDEGLIIELNGEQIMGRLRVFMNLLRPIKMLLTARPPSVFDLFTTDHGNGGLEYQSTLDRAYHNTEAIFWLPRGTTKVLYLNINCPTMEVISVLLAKFNIRNNPKKFALYEHTIKSSTEVEVRKLSLLQCPLKIMLDWCSKDVEYFYENLKTKRFVLQENDPGSIEWDEFSIHELRSFLTILAQEEADKRKSIECKYDILRSEIRRRLTLKRSLIQETVSVYL